MKRISLAMAECAIYNSRKLITPLHFGLATQMHHENGKSSILDALNANGFCVSCDELRKFLTAAGKHEMSRTEDGINMPAGILPVSGGGYLIHEGDDNVDVNAETINGKYTFHSMDKMIFQNQQIHVNYQVPDSVHIPFGSDKSLKLTEAECIKMTQLFSFEKPKQQLEPPRKPNVIDLFKSCVCHELHM